MIKKYVIIGVFGIIVIFGGIFIVLKVRQNPDTTMQIDTTQSDTTPTQDVNNVDDPVPFESALDNPAYADDLDRDGIPNEKEIELGTDPNDFDTDGDGIDDKQEIDVYKTDPTKLDTDGDGFADGVELINGYNPNGDGKLQ